MKDLAKLEEQYKKLGEEIEALKNEKKLPSTWEEYCENNHKSIWHDGFELMPNRFNQGLPNKYIALRKLELLRDCYNDGWVADWTDDNEKKYVIYFNDDVLEYNTFWHTKRFLHFKTEELRDLFLENFRDLIEEARPLL